jgi:hypothetical protein
VKAGVFGFRCRFKEVNIYLPVTTNVTKRFSQGQSGILGSSIVGKSCAQIPSAKSQTPTLLVWPSARLCRTVGTGNALCG